MAASTRVVVVGAGIFGVTAALELRVRGHAVSLLDPGPLPHALAASTDVSKVVRLEYGAGNEYMELAERALAGWHRWNRDLGEELYHETGILHLSRSPMKPGGFEHESFRLLEKRGHSPERLDARALGERFPAWRGGPFVDGFFHAKGGWVESGKVVSRLVRLAKERGVSLHEGVAFDRLLEKGSRVTGAIAKDGSRIEGDGVVVAAGAWTPHLLPFLSPYLRTRGMPVFHLRPRASEVFSPARFPVFTADIARTGYYGFPLHPELSIVKVARHSAGREMHPESPERAVTASETDDLRAFLSASLPSLADAEIAATRVCLYCDTRDGDFWIAPDPDREGLVVASGDSGHAFKFAPVLGALVADAVTGVENALSGKLRWRPEARASGEAARFLGDET